MQPAVLDNAHDSGVIDLRAVAISPSSYIPIVAVPAAPPRDRRPLVAMITSLVTLAITCAVLMVVVVRGRSSGVRESTEAPAATAVIAHQPPTTAYTVPRTVTRDAQASSAPIAARSSAVSGSTSGTPRVAAVAASDPKVDKPRAAARSIAIANPASRPTASVPRVEATSPAPQQQSASRDGERTNASEQGNAAHTEPASVHSEPAASPVAAPDGCSEAACVLGDFDQACCAPYKPKQTPAAAAPVVATLDRAAITAGVGTISTRTCAGRSSQRGNVAVSIKVAPDGGVASVTIKSSPDDALSACVNEAIRKGRFARTEHGGSFAYVWLF